MLLDGTMSGLAPTGLCDRLEPHVAVQVLAINPSWIFSLCAAEGIAWVQRP